MNGAAPVGGSVILHPEGQTRLSLSKPTAVIGNDGSFTVRTNYQDGAPVGRYKVTFFWAGDPRVPKSVPPQDERSLNQNQIPHPYSSVADTPFSIEVAPEANVLPLFQLRSDLK
ncbi:hypothetical protein [Tuwongella immobilis]|nr:hypothetical protein [Tuwongella immobilis]